MDSLLIKEFTYLDSACKICYWVCLSCWSLSYYGQLVLNNKSKSVKGYSLDYCLFNLIGFFVYSITCIFSFIDEVNTNQISIGNLVFSIHGLILSAVLFKQTLLYSSDNQDESFSSFSLYSFTSIITMLSILLFCEKVDSLYDPNILSKDQNFKFNSESLSGVIIIYCTFFKYLSQLLLNYKNTSTIGFSSINVYLELSGSVFCLAQGIISAINNEDFNIVKCIICSFSFAFSFIFIIQRLIYKNNQGEVNKDNEYDNSLKHSVLDFSNKNSDDVVTSPNKSLVKKIKAENKKIRIRKSIRTNKTKITESTNFNTFASNVYDGTLRASRKSFFSDENSSSGNNTMIRGSFVDYIKDDLEVIDEI